MTDGIIQKIFLEVLLEDDPHTDTIVTMNKIEHRLIAEIAKTCDKHINDKCYIYRLNLIGDNQE